MNKETYVKFETAKHLKEKGFDWKVFYFYDEIGRMWFEDVRCDWNHRITPEVSCPAQQMACDWLEETYGFFIEISRSIDLNGNYHYFYMILDKECKYASSATKDNNYSSKSDAVEAALEYCLTNLI